MHILTTVGGCIALESVLSNYLISISYFAYHLHIITAVGCIDLELPSDTVSSRNNDVLTVTCKKTGQTFTLKCHENKWIGKVEGCGAGTGLMKNLEPYGRFYLFE